LFVDATFRSGDMQCRVRKSRKRCFKIWCFCALYLVGRLKFFWRGIFKSTPLPT